jgi:H/ACA ribonucleoprotein complex subunit 4
MERIKKLLSFGIIPIDKPTGPTSFTITDFVRKELNINKTSHFGTLDPKVTGVLPIALGRACRLANLFLGENKTYVGIIRVHKEISIEELQKIINQKFIGKIKQLPPRKSSVKRAIREREIVSFEILEKQEKNFLFQTEVQGGTYIRKLCSDLGEFTEGAHMLELRRTRAGIFTEQQTVTLYEFEKAIKEYRKGNSEFLERMIISAEKAIKEVVESVELKEGSLNKILTGKPILKEDLQTTPKEDTFAIFLKERFIEIARKTDERDFFARPSFVLN